LTWICN